MAVAVRGGWLVTVRSVACRLLPRSLCFLRCSAAPLPTFACPSPSFCSFCSSSHPRSIPSLALPLGLLYFYLTETYLCSDTYQNVWFYLHRGSSRKGEAEGDFWSKAYWTTLRYILHICTASNRWTDRHMDRLTDSRAYVRTYTRTYIYTQLRTSRYSYIHI